MVLGQPDWHAYIRFDEQDVLRFFAEREARLAPPAPPDPAGGDRRGAGGAPRKYPWDELGAAFGAWLHQEPGRDQLSASKHLDALAEIAGELGSEAPDRSTASPYRKAWLKGYRAFVAVLDRRDGN